MKKSMPTVSQRLTEVEEKLGFIRIRESLAGYCLFLPGLDRCNEIAWVSDPALVKTMQDQTSEFFDILLGTDPFPTSNYFDVRPFLKKLKPENSYLEENEIWEISLFLSTVKAADAFLNNRITDFPELNKLRVDVDFIHDLHKSINSKLDPSGKIRDNATPDLSRIRKRKSEIEGKQQKTIERAFAEALKNGFVPEGTTVSVRRGRTVIPVMAEHKRKVHGIIHDHSASGTTVFIEPDSVLEISNEFQELMHEERREIVKILTAMSQNIKEYESLITATVDFLGIMDFLRAKGKLAITLNATRALFSDQPKVALREARHPLFVLQEDKEVVPLNLKLDRDVRIVLISGPNAGGKSVALKTVGLIQYMYQCGLLVPVSGDSEIGVFKDLFLDIGDQQSIENDLSTYSSHLTNMVEILNEGNNQSMVLIDEMGSGTEPKLGAAIAEAIIEGILKKGCYGVITTHYSNLKQFAENNPGIENAAMLFDINNLTPFYTLEQGRQGGSFALEVAMKIGLPDHILRRAKEIAGTEIISLEEILGKLDKERKELENRSKKLAVSESEAESNRKMYLDLKNRLEENKKKILLEAAETAESLIRETNKEIEKTIRHIKENKAERKETKKIRERLDAFKDKNVKVHAKKEKLTIQREKLKSGDQVRIIGRDVGGEIIELKKKEAVILIGNIRTKVALSELEKTSSPVISSPKSGYQITRPMAGISQNLDIRGNRVEEAISKLEKFLDDAIIAGFNSVSVLHGKGDGILRKVVREKLSKLPFVKKFEDEHVERGGAGVTIVYME